MKNPDLKSKVIDNKQSKQQSISDLDRLRKLIVGIDRDQANHVIDRVSDAQLRGNDIHEVLIDAIEQLDISEQEAILAHFSGVTKSRLQQYVSEEPDEVSAIIYPVMLPAIRSAGSGIEAKRKGISYGEVFLRHTINYGVEQAFLIDSSSGMLMQHVSLEEDSKKDEDAVSAMFLAIERFVNDSFNDSDETLRRVTVGERVVYIAHGPKALLACVVRGTPPSDFRSDIESILERIHAAASTKLSTFAGDKTTLSSVAPLMAECLELEIEKETSDNTDDFNKKIKLAGQLLMFGLVFLGAFLFYNHMQNKRIDAYVHELNALDNVQIFTSGKEAGHWHLNGIIDPTISAELPRLPKTIFANEEKIKLSLTPIIMLPSTPADSVTE